MAGVLTSLRRLKDGCLHALSSRLTRWTKPLGNSLLLSTLVDLGRSKSDLIAENALLRQQLIILQRQIKRPTFTGPIACSSSCWPGWFEPGSRLCCLCNQTPCSAGIESSFASSGNGSQRRLLMRPRSPPKPSRFLRQMAKDNRLWGAERIRGALLKLGIHVCKRTIQKYMRNVRSKPPRGQKWSTDLAQSRRTVQMTILRC